jgi:hypothetical protein
VCPSGLVHVVTYCVNQTYLGFVPCSAEPFINCEVCVIITHANGVNDVGIAGESVPCKIGDRQTGVTNANLPRIQRANGNYHKLTE